MSREAKTPAENDRGSCASLAAQCLIRPRLTRPRLTRPRPSDDKAVMCLGLLPQKAVPTRTPDAESPAPPETPTSRDRDRQFESPSLQRRVSCEPNPRERKRHGNREASGSTAGTRADASGTEHSLGDTRTWSRHDADERRTTPVFGWCVLGEASRGCR